MAFSGITKLISQLTATTSISDTDNLIVGNTDAKKITWAQIISIINNKLHVGDLSYLSTSKKKDLVAAINEVYYNDMWSNLQTVGSQQGITLKYKYTKSLVEIIYEGTLTKDVTYGAGTIGYSFPEMPEEYLPPLNLREPIFCPSNNNALCLRIFPYSTKQWSISSESKTHKSVSEYLFGSFIYSRR